jgi:pilus assembly protein Flp/PilA
MRTLFGFATRLGNSDEGPTAVEYAVMLAAIIIVCITAITAVGRYPSAQFNTVSNSIGSGS